MLNEETFARGIQLMNSVCTKQIETDDTMNVYYMTLSDVDEEYFLDAIMSLIKSKENIYNPFSPAEIINKVKELKNSKLKAKNVFDRLKLDAIRYGSANKPKYKPEIEEALEAIGGWGEFCNSTDDNEFYLQRDFIKELNSVEIKNENLLGSNTKKLEQ